MFVCSSSDCKMGRRCGGGKPAAWYVVTHEDMELDHIKTPKEARWERWRHNAAHTAYNFLHTTDTGIMADEQPQQQQDLRAGGDSAARDLYSATLVFEGTTPVPG